MTPIAILLIVLSLASVFTVCVLAIRDELRTGRMNWWEVGSLVVVFATIGLLLAGPL